jgi:UDP-N-acetylmuramate--alanine ligase
VAPIGGADGTAICRAVRSPGRVEPVFVPEIEQLAPAIARLLAPGDVVVTMGAGSIGSVAAALGAQLAAQQPSGSTA